MNPIDIVYVFGAGSVEGAWDPVLRAVEKTIGRLVARDVADWWFGLQGRRTAVRSPENVNCPATAA